MFHIDDIDAGSHIFLTMLTFSMNLSLMCWIAWKMAVEVVYEFQKQAKEKMRKKSQGVHRGGEAEEGESSGDRWVECLTCCTKRTQRWCPCLREDSQLRRTLSGHARSFKWATPVFLKARQDNDDNDNAIGHRRNKNTPPSDKTTSVSIELPDLLDKAKESIHNETPSNSSVNPLLQSNMRKATNTLPPSLPLRTPPLPPQAVPLTIPLAVSEVKEVESSGKVDQSHLRRTQHQNKVLPNLLSQDKVTLTIMIGMIATFVGSLPGAHAQLVPSCPVTNGTSSNPFDCSCGSHISCNAIAGFVCIASADYCGLPCPAGSYLNFTTGTCVGCPAGKYERQSHLVSESQCKGLCPKGRYSNQTGLTSPDECKLCAMGKYSSSFGLQTNCQFCDYGKYNNKLGRGSPCTACPPGRFMYAYCGDQDESNHNALSDCRVCDVDTYQNENGKLKCKRCEHGKQIPENITPMLHDNSDDCLSTDNVPIPVDVMFTHSMVVDNVTNFTSIVLWKIPTNSESITFIEIQMSPTFDFATPLPLIQNIPASIFSIEYHLPTAMWQSVMFARVRTVLDSGLKGAWSDKSIGWLTAKDCGEYNYLNNTSPIPTNWTCMSCPDGASCNGKPWALGVQALFGWFRVPSDTIPEKFVQCLYPGACLGARNEAEKGRFLHPITEVDLALTANEERCNEDYGFENNTRQCHTCKYGWRRLDRVRCAGCPSAAKNWLLMLLGVLLVTAAVVIFVKMTVAHAGHTKISESIQKIMINYLQVITVFRGFPLRWPPAIEGLFDFQGAISTVGDHLLNPDCAAETFWPTDTEWSNSRWWWWWWW